MIQKLISFKFIVILFLVAGCATNPVSGKKNFVLMSEEQEIDLGDDYSREVMKQYKVYEDPELTALVNRLGQKLAKESHRNDLEFHFTLLDSPEVNAFALPGGHIYITRGIISYMNNEEQLAGVLGHEIGHVTARHSVRQHAASTTAGLVGVLATVATGSSGVADLSNSLGGALVSGYGRSHELEADRLGAEYLARTGYDPQLMLGVVGILKDQEEFEIQKARLENRQPRIYHGVYSSHPDNDRRLQEVIQAAEKFKNPDAPRSDPESFLSMLDGITFGDNEGQGVVRDNRFYHKGLDFAMEFPSGWKIDNLPDRLVSVNMDNSAAMMVRVDTPKLNESPAEYLKRNFGNFRRGQKLGVNGYTGVVQGENPFGTKEYRVAAVFHVDHVFIVFGAGKNGSPDRQFFSSVDSIRPLQGAERELATAKRIKLVRAKPGDSFASLARRSDIGIYAEQQLRLLNGMYPEGEPQVGQLVKIVE